MEINESLQIELDSALAEHSAGPVTGIFTDGGARPNPGPGGWGLVYVVENEVKVQKCGQEPDTTNNRMELQALIEAYRLIEPGESVDIYSDSNLCVQTINQWAAMWEKNSWRRKSGPIQNLERVQELYGLAQQRPQVKLQWVKAHNGWRWNEYADILASAWTF